MGDAVQLLFDAIPSLLGTPVGDLEDLTSGQVALAGYFCDNLCRPAPGQRYLARQLRYASRPGDAPANVLDLGDVNVFPLEPEKHFAAVASQCMSVLGSGARLVLVGGDKSGAKALVTAAQQAADGEVQEVSLTGADCSAGTAPIVLSVDLDELAGNWLSRPHRPSGLTPAQMIARIGDIPGNIVGAALFGMAPALDSRGTTETRAALAILRALADRLGKRAS